MRGYHATESTLGMVKMTIELHKHQSEDTELHSEYMDFLRYINDDLKEYVKQVFFSPEQMSDKDIGKLAKRRIRFTKSLLDSGELSNDDATILFRLCISDLLNAKMSQTIDKSLHKPGSKSRLKRLWNTLAMGKV